MERKIQKDFDHHFLARAVRNDLNPKEKVQFEEWLARSPQNREVFNSIIEVWEKSGLSQNISPPDPDRQWESIVSSLRMSEKSNSTREERSYKIQPTGKMSGFFLSGVTQRFFHSAYGAAVAAVLLLAVIGVLLYKYENPATHRTSQLDLASANQSTEISTRKGEKKSLILQDGSRIYLNASSKLTLPNNFNISGRRVELEGEAYLSISPDKNNPFYVKCGNIVTIVRGTEFNIKNRGESVSVVVVKGLVETYTYDSSKGYALKKGEIVSYDVVNGLSQPKKADLRHALAWRYEKFSFSHTSLKEAMDEIERFYNVKVVFTNESLKKKTISGYFNTDSMDSILNLIGVALNISITCRDGVVTITEHAHHARIHKG